MSDQPNRTRDLPADLYRLLEKGTISASEAQRRARERFEDEAAHGLSMNDRIRLRLAGTSPEGRIQRDNAVRDARGRFSREQDDDEGKPKQPTMNELIRDQLANGSSESGTFEMDLSHLSGGPAPDEAA